MIDADPVRHVCIWEYEVHPDHVAEFEEMYGSDGDGSGCSDARPGTTTPSSIGNRDKTCRFIRVDYWQFEEAWLEWRGLFDAQFDELDRLGKRLTVSEREMGRFERVVGP